MTPTTPHTPTPWYTPDRGPSSPYFQGQISDEATGRTIVITYNDKGGPNAKHIVHCVNTHAALVAALEGLYAHCSMIHKWWGEDDNNRQASAAIAAGRAALALAAGKE